MDKEPIIIVKELIAQPSNRIKLDEFITEQVKKFLGASDLQHFPVQGIEPQAENPLERIKQYEKLVHDLEEIVILLARWGDTEHQLLLEKIFRRLAESEKGSSGSPTLIHLEWYPLQVLMYAAGISALSARKYAALKISLETPTRFQQSGKIVPLVVPVTTNIADANDQFKKIPGYEAKHTPRSDYFLDLLKNPLNELLFLGGDYESLFDKFEIYSALSFVEATNRRWVPLGRFGWKYDLNDTSSPFHQMIEESKKEGMKWAPLQAGLFDGSQETFNDLSTVLASRLNGVTWD